MINGLYCKIGSNYLDKYQSINFEIFPNAIDKRDKLKNKEQCAQEVNDLLCLQMNKVINEKGNAWWESTTKEVGKV